MNFPSLVRCGSQVALMGAATFSMGYISGIATQALVEKQKLEASSKEYDTQEARCRQLEAIIKQHEND